MSKKRTSLQSFVSEKVEEEDSKDKVSNSSIVRLTAYLPVEAHERLRKLAFEERRKLHDYLIEGLNRVFENRGLPLFIKKDYRKLDMNK